MGKERETSVVEKRERGELMGKKGKVWFGMRDTAKEGGGGVC